jgi:multicomponent Na+:H+ antiporter subunit B
VKRIAVIAVLVAAFVPLAAAVTQLPPFGEATNPTNTYVAPRYLQRGPEEAGAPNVVTDIILNYRGYDTNGEVAVIFTALIAALATLLVRPRQVAEAPPGDDAPRSPIVSFVVKAIAPFIAVFTVYLVLHGHLSPGGGFQGGTIFGALIILSSLTLGHKYGLRVLPERSRPWLQAAAVLAFIAVGLLGWTLCGAYLAYPAYPELEWVREAWLIALEIGIGVGGAAIFATVFWTMEAEP